VIARHRAARGRELVVQLRADLRALVLGELRRAAGERDRMVEQRVALRQRGVVGLRNRCGIGVRRWRLRSVRRGGLSSTASSEHENQPLHGFDVSVTFAMALWFAALLGLVQGLTEFIPVSSTAHLRVVPALFGMRDAGAAYTAVLQLGTLAAVIIYFAKDLIAIPHAMIRAPGTPEGRLPWMLAVGTVPIVIAGLAFKKHIEGDLRSLYVIAGALVAVGIVMAIIDQTSAKSGTRPLSSLTYTDAVMVGLAQTLALVPGVSRSGATICMALLLGFTRSEAARFSFLLSIPAVAGAGILEARTAFHELGTSAIPALAVGTGVAAVTGYATIAWFLRWLGSHQLVGFAIYRIACGVALLAALAAGYIASL
jgi:undecaprenyl-diphosphatase